MSDKNFEEKLKKHWREEADSIPVPDSLHPAKIEEMIDKKWKFLKTHPQKLYAGITAAAACLALLIAGTAYYFNTGQQSEKEPLLPIRSKPSRTDTSLSAIPVIQKFIA